MNLPFLTTDLPGIGGAIKQREEDFFVQEIPLYEPAGEGEHVYCEVQKVGLTTFDALHRIGNAFNISVRDIGYAGLKDAKAITRQVFSIPLVPTEAVMALKLPDITVLWAARHLNKLRLGHLKGNRFAIKIRDVNPTDVVKLRPMIDVIEKHGMPNYFGEQRFGWRGNSDLLGGALIAGDNVRLLQLLLGSPDPAIDDSQTLGARGAFDRRDNETAMRLYPRSHGMERRILARLMKTHKPNAAVRGIDQKLRRLWVSALQSRVFNQTLATRLEAGTMDRLIDGDLAMKHENGACFSVEDVAAEQPRVDTFEISPTGPMVGYRMTLPKGEALKLEEEVFKQVGVTPESFRNTNERAKGERRALRVKPTDIQLSGGVDEHGGHITVAFSLPSGSYATMFLRELMKSDQLEATSTEDAASLPTESV
ncbi:tRNA pseudouridine(13) synthase TruD [soil metagenome]